MPHNHLLEGDIRPFLDGRAVDLVSDYFSPAYTGNQFHRLGGGGDVGPEANVFTPVDLIAVSMLDVHVPGEAALQILGPLSLKLTTLLSDIPTVVALEDSDESLIDDGSPADQLWFELTRLPDVGRTIAGKLIARKRPRLIPVFDSVIKDALLPKESNYWKRLRNELQDQKLVDRLREVRTESGIGSSIPLIRVLDVAVWMRNRRGSTNKIPFTPRPEP
jgi:hypothetical protein